MEDLTISAIYEKEETSPKQETNLREKALTVLHYATTGLKDRKSEYPGMNFFEHPLDCASVAEGFGVPGFKVNDPDDLQPTLEKAFGLGKPTVVDVHLHPGDY